MCPAPYQSTLHVRERKPTTHRSRGGGPLGGGAGGAGLYVCLGGVLKRRTLFGIDGGGIGGDTRRTGAEGGGMGTGATGAGAALTDGAGGIASACGCMGTGACGWAWGCMGTGACGWGRRGTGAWGCIGPCACGGGGGRACAACGGGGPEGPYPFWTGWCAWGYVGGPGPGTEGGCGCCCWGAGEDGWSVDVSLRAVSSLSLPLSRSRGVAR